MSSKQAYESLLLVVMEGVIFALILSELGSVVSLLQVSLT